MHQIAVPANPKQRNGRSRLKWICALFLAFLFFVFVLVVEAQLKGAGAVNRSGASDVPDSSKGQHEWQGLQPSSPAALHHDVGGNNTQQNAESSKEKKQEEQKRDRLCGYRWNGEFIRDEKTMKGGSCFCGRDEYCVCSPSLAIDCVIEMVVVRVEKDEDGIVMKGGKKGRAEPPKGTDDTTRDSGAGNEIKAISVVESIAEQSRLIGTATDVMIVLVFRKDPPRGRYAIPGGFVQIGESAEDATVREVLEETNITVSREALDQFRFYSHPTRDPRRHTASMVFRYRAAEAYETSKRSILLQHMSAGDDAKAVKAVSLIDALNRSKLTMAFDHRAILEDYARRYHPHLLTSLSSLHNQIN